MPDQVQNIVEQSLAQAVGADERESDDVFPNFLSWVVRTGDLVPPWWSQARDTRLGTMWKESNHLSIAVYNTQAKIVGIPPKIVPRDPAITEHLDQAEELQRMLLTTAEFGRGWEVAYSKFVEALITQDNGAFMEIIGRGPADGPIIGQPLSVRHLDSNRCTRSGNPVYPVIYMDDHGQRWKMHFTRVLYMSQMPSQLKEMNGVGFCLDRDATVLMANGKYKRIADIVNGRLDAKVMSVDGTGSFVHSRITGWYKSERGERRMVNIRGRYASMCKGSKERNSWVTEDHPVMTPMGWVNAGDLETGDKIITGLPTPNAEQMRFLVGTMLGDGHLQPSTNRVRFTMGHALKQEEWLDTKAAFISEFEFLKRYGTQKLEYKGHITEHDLVYGQTKHHAGLIRLRETFYPDGKKVFPEQLVRDYMCPRLMATWYLDDGHIVDREPNERNRNPHARISTGGYTIEEVTAMVEMLNEFGYKCSIISSRGEPDKRDIRFSVKGSELLFADIAAYVPPSMRYKLPVNAAEYEPVMWGYERADGLIDTIEVVEWNKPNSQPEYVYCIDVEDTHNFISAGIVVHNCAVSRSVEIAQTLVDIIRYKQERLGSRPHNQILVGQGITGRQIMLALRQVEEDLSNKGFTKYARTVAIGSENTEIGIEKIDLNHMEPFDEEVSMNLGMFAISSAFGMDAEELWPVGGKSAGKQEANIRRMRSRGRLPAQITSELSAQFNYKVIPPHLKWMFDFQDDEEDMQRANIKDIRGRNRERDLGTGAINVRAARMRMLEDGDIDRSTFRQLEMVDGRLPDGKSIAMLFFSSDPVHSRMIGGFMENPLSIVENITDIEEELSFTNEAKLDKVLIDIQDQRAVVLEAMSRSNSTRLSEKMELDFHALDWLEQQYLFAAGRILPEVPMQQRRQRTDIRVAPAEVSPEEGTQSPAQAAMTVDENLENVGVS